MVFESFNIPEPGVVTAIVGSAGTGKTTLCLFLARKARNPYFIDTEGLSLERVKQVRALHIKVARARSFEEQHNLIMNFSEDADMLIVDSLVMLYRLALPINAEEANRKLALQMAKLHELAEILNIPVIITGHIYRKEGKRRIVGGDIVKYWAKAIVLLERLEKPGLRRAILLKHRSKPEKISIDFRLCEKGICW